MNAWTGTKLIEALRKANKQQKDYIIRQFEHLVNIDAKKIREKKYTASVECPCCSIAASLIVSCGMAA